MRKSHPLRRAVLAGAATVTGIVLLLSLKPTTDPGAAVAGEAAPPATAAPSAQGGRDAVSDTVAGDVVDTRFGAVQVRITVSDGLIIASEAVQAPEGGQSGRISSDAVPRLDRAAVAAGGADIDAVSGATYTSAGYRQSLQSALDRAAG
ncbi:FMN-binding protein [Streptomyces sp. ZYX-F-203]